MKKTILVLLVSGLFAIGANAQDVPAPPKPGQNPPAMSKEKMQVLQMNKSKSTRIY